MNKITWRAGLALGHTVFTFIVTPVTFAGGNPTPNDSCKQALKSISNSELNTYRNEKYGFELKYPKNWSVRSSTETIGGQRWLEEIIIKDHPPEKGRITRNTYRDIYIKIYKLVPEDKDKNILIKNISTDEYHLGYSFSNSCLSSNAATNVMKGISFVEISISDSNPQCFYSGAYFFSEEKGGYIFNIIPVPRFGIGYVGYDGKKMVSDSFPEFYDILSTIKFTK